MTACLEALGLCYRYGSRIAVDDVSIQVEPGEIVGLLGPNGAGKTTFFKMISGLLKPDSGRILLNGQDLNHLPLWKRARLGLGYLPQGPTLFRRLTVQENLEIARNSVSKEALSDSQLGEIVQLLGLVPLLQSKGQSLSGGERRRAEIARALALKPQVLLIDEPFAGLDPLSTEALTDHLKALSQKGISILMTDHDVPQTLHLCQRIAILIEGRIFTQGPSAAVAESPEVAQLYLGRLARPY